jgi:histidyl-tRNA synthetase
MAKLKPRTLSGFMELLPEKQVLFDRMVAELRRTYSLYGVHPPGHPPHRGQRGAAGQGRR